MSDTADKPPGIKLAVVEANVFIHWKHWNKVLYKWKLTPDKLDHIYVHSPKQCAVTHAIKHDIPYTVIEGDWNNSDYTKAEIGRMRCFELVNECDMVLMFYNPRSSICRCVIDIAEDMGKHVIRINNAFKRGPPGRKKLVAKK